MTEDRSHYTVTPSETQQFGEQILALLRQARAANLRITGAQIAARLEQPNDRKIRIVIQQLIERGELIAASNHEPFGYFLIEDPHDATIYEATLRSRAHKTLKRLRDFRKAFGRKFGYAQQLPLFAVEAAIKELER